MTAAGDFFYDGIASATRLALFDGGDNLLYIYAGATIGTVAQPAGYAILTAVFESGNSGELFVDGASGFTGAPGTNDSGGFTVGARWEGDSPLTGDIAEMIVYPSALSADDRGTVETCLANKYSIILSLIWNPDYYERIAALEPEEWKEAA